MTKLSKIAQLRAAGFDRSEHIPFTRIYRVRCSMCEALVINHTPCHEQGCPNSKRNEDGDDDQD